MSENSITSFIEAFHHTTNNHTTKHVQNRYSMVLIARTSSTSLPGMRTASQDRYGPGGFGSRTVGQVRASIRGWTEFGCRHPSGLYLFLVDSVWPIPEFRLSSVWPMSNSWSVQSDQSPSFGYFFWRIHIFLSVKTGLKPIFGQFSLSHTQKSVSSIWLIHCFWSFYLANSQISVWPRVWARANDQKMGIGQTEQSEYKYGSDRRD